MNKKLNVFDFTLKKELVPNHIELLKIMSIFCKKVTFQLEKGEKTGYLHYQGRISTKERKRMATLINQTPKELRGISWYLTSNSNKDNSEYVMKEETRVSGPWTLNDLPKYIPRQYRGLINNLRPFQQHIWDSCDKFDSRSINLIYDPITGNNGKTVIAALCELYGRGIDLPFTNDAVSLIQIMCDICKEQNKRNPSPIFIDLPRAISKQNLRGIFSAIEQIKKGKLYDPRYKYKCYWIDSPQIWVFTNVYPELSLLSPDRWNLWKITDNFELEEIDIQKNILTLDSCILD